jgi:hypothetical protein
VIAIDDIIAVTERTCRVIAPQDLGDVPLYIVPVSRLPADRGGLSVCDGFTSPSLDLYLRDVIGPAWHGRGACMVVRDVAPEGTMDERDVATAFMGVAIHELAHILGRWELYAPRNEADDAILAEATDMARRVAGPLVSEHRRIPFYGHGATFIRIVLHLCHRADVANVPVAPREVCDTVGHCLSPINVYRSALGAEPRRLARASMREVVATPYPKAFWHLWTSDVAQWLSHCPPELERRISSCL